MSSRAWNEADPCARAGREPGTARSAAWTRFAGCEAARATAAAALVLCLITLAACQSTPEKKPPPSTPPPPPPPHASAPAGAAAAAGSATPGTASAAGGAAAVHPDVPAAARADFDRAVNYMRSGNAIEAELGFKAVALQYPQFAAPLVNLAILQRK